MTPRRVIEMSLIAVLFGSVVWGQRDLATLTGTVTDQTGAAIPDAKVTITEIGTGLAYTLTTDQSGVYVRPALKPSTYTVQVEAKGFKTATQRGVLLTAGDRVGANFTLEVGEATQHVEVEAGAPLLETENTNMGGGLNSRATADLPLGGQREIAFLARLSVGVTVDEVGAAGALGGGFSAAGVASMGNSNYLLNGVDNNQNNIDYQGLAAYVVSLPPEAVGEIRVLTNGYNAEYGRGGGGVMEVTMKSGTNDIHGVAYEFLQNEDLNATTWDANKAGTGKGTWRQNQFGASVGGPIIKNRTFWFANYQGLRFQSFGAAIPGTFGTSTSYTIPTQAMIQGNFSSELAVAGQNQLYDPLSTTSNGSGGYTRVPFPGNIIPPSRMDPVAKAILSGLPAPNENLNAPVPGSNYYAPALAKEPNDQGNARIDHKISDKDYLFGSVSWSQGQQINPPATGLTVNDGALSPGFVQNQGSRLGMLSYTRIWTPALLSETRVAFTRSVQDRILSTQNQDEYKAYGIPGYDPFTTQAGGGLPDFVITNYSTLGSPDFEPSLENTSVWDFIQNVAVNRGKHAFKFGAEFRPVRLPTFQPNQTFGQMSFTKNMTDNPTPALAGITGDALASFELGYLSQFAYSSPSSIYEAHYAWAFYAQDDWKITPKLTLNLGLRYELFSPFYDNMSGSADIVPANNPSGWAYEVAAGPHENESFAPAQTDILSAAGVPVTIGQVSKYVVPWDKLDFGPRLGIAYQALSKTVVRAAFGIFYNGEQNRGGFTPLDENPPFAENINYTGPTYTLDPYIARLSDGFPTNVFDQNIPGSTSLHGYAPDLLNPRVDKWDVALQRELPGNSSIEVSYMGNYMSHLFVVWDPNYPANTTVSVSSASLNQLRPNPALGGMPNYLFSNGIGNFNAGSVKYERRYSKGLQFQAVYTYGHVLSDAPTGAWGEGNIGAPNAGSFGSAYANAPWDIRQNFVANANYELPFGKGKAFGSNWNSATNAILGNWQMNGILTLHTGHFFTVTTTEGVGYLGYYHGAPQYYASVLPGDASNGAPPTGRTPGEWFNTANYAVPTPYVQGNLGNSTNTYPGVEDLDLSLFKFFPIGERYRFTFRAEAFNLFNTPNFSTIGSTQGVGNFGQLLTTVAGSNRRLQLGLQFAF
jgi:Carboxypeptidase regulatory-like domain